ncbi:MAG: hypothetical protein M3460_20845 [Actinomycetota bacterium]|nr:hypothetical protein [Actinomycetota bacterium]
MPDGRRPAIPQITAVDDRFGTPQVRRGLHRGRHPDPDQSTRSAPSERDLRTHDRNTTPRAARQGSVINERHLCRILAIYIQHFNAVRPHRTLGQLAPDQAETQPPPVINLASYQVHRRPILDGLTNEYHLAA